MIPVLISHPPPAALIQRVQGDEIVANITIVEFVFDGNTVFTDQELGQAISDFTGKPVRLEALHEAVERLTRLYVEQGYVTSGAYLPIQPTLDPQQAEIAIQIIEGSIEEIAVQGSPRLQSYVRDRLQVATHPVLNMEQLEEALRKLHLDPRVESVSATLLPGNSDNASVLEVEAISAPLLNVQASVNDFRSPGVGNVERGGQVELRNAAGLGEMLALNIDNTDGSTGFAIEGALPINLQNGELFFQYGDFQGRVLSEPFRVFDIRVDSTTYAGGFRQPLIDSVSLEDGDARLEFLSVGATVERTESRSTVDGQPTPLSPGANRLGETGILEVALSQEYLTQGAGRSLAIRSQVGVGFNDNPVADFQDFVVFSGQVAYQRAIGSVSFLLGGRAQFSLDPLVPIKQFAIGGPGSVLGYQRDSILSDNGLVAISELQIPFVQAGDLTISATPFANVGVGWNHGSDRAIQRNTLASVGAGLQIDWGNFGGRVNYAFPLIDGQRDPISFELFFRYGI